MRDAEIVRSPLRGIRYLLRSAVECYRDALVVIWARPFLFLFSLGVCTAASAWQAKNFARIGYSDLLVMGWINYGMVAAEVLATMPLVFLAHRKLLPAFHAQTYQSMNVPAAVIRYLAVALGLYSANNVGFFFCLFGDSANGPGLWLCRVMTVVVCLFWLRLIAFFPSLALGLMQDRPKLPEEIVKGRLFQTALILGLAMAPLYLLKLDVTYWISLILLYLLHVPAGDEFIRNAVWYFLHRFVFVMTWVFIAVIGSKLLDRRIGSDPEFSTLDPLDLFNPRSRKN